MTNVRYILVSEGSSDRVLIPLLDWLLKQNGVTLAQSDDSKWPDLRELPRPPQNLQERIKKVLEVSDPFDLLFVHRDADNQGYDTRKQQILDSLSEVTVKPPVVCVVPVRMQETWLLFNEAAIRQTAGKPDGRVKLNLPLLKNLESEADPKSKLHQALKTASALKGRKLNKFNVHFEKYRLVQYLAEHEGFAALRSLDAFNALEADIQVIITEQGWNVD